VKDELPALIARAARLSSAGSCCAGNGRAARLAMVRLALTMPATVALEAAMAGSVGTAIRGITAAPAAMPVEGPMLVAMAAAAEVTAAAIDALILPPT
jgi:hypothetical protein